MDSETSYRRLDGLLQKIASRSVTGGYTWFQGYSKPYPIKYTKQKFMDRVRQHKRAVAGSVSGATDPLVGGFVQCENTIDEFPRLNNSFFSNDFSKIKPADNFSKTTPATKVTYSSDE